jgi:hypothetical protein
MYRLEIWWIWAGVQCAAGWSVIGRLRVRQIASGAKATTKACGVVVAMLPG